MATASSTQRVTRPVEFSTTGFCPVFHGAEVARRSEELGFDVQMYGENHAKAPDVFGEIRDAARATSRIRLLSGPVNFVTRDPGVVASAIAPIQVLSGGRAICGIARGDSAVGMAGRQPQRQVAFERDLLMLRTYLDGGEVDHGVRTSRLEWSDPDGFARVPVEVVCSGPKAIGMAARIADRIGLSVGYHPDRVRWALDVVDEALAAVGRPRDEVRVGLFGPLAVTADRSVGIATLRSRTAPWAHMSSFKGNDLSAQPPQLRRVTEVLREGYDYAFHGKLDTPDNPNDAAVDDEFCDWYGVGGPPSYVLDRFGELVELGVDWFCVVGAPIELEAFAGSVMEPLRDLRR